MKRTKKLMLAVIFITATTLSYAQKGTGNHSGVARNNSVDEIEQISGEIEKIVNETCTQTTGRYSEGTHIFVQTDQGANKNVHFGPTAEVSELTEQLEAGQHIQLKVFRTEDLPEHHVIAKSFTGEGKTHQLRDNALKPFWAGKKHQGRGRQSSSKW